MHAVTSIGFSLLFTLLRLTVSAVHADAREEGRPEPIARRPITFPTREGVWGGVGVCYGPFRDGQSPVGASPTTEQVREDLHILARHWRMVRMYGSRGATREACRIIREDKLPMRLMVGAWIAQESKPDSPEGVVTDAEAAEANRAEVATAIALANEFPDVVFALNIGNEALVDWSDHRVHPRVIIRYLREARMATKVPVTTCDTELFWNKPESRAVAAECDFLGLHAYAMWNKQSLSTSMGWTRDRLREVKTLHPELPVVLCETGWATRKGTQGYQGVGIVATPSEEDQELFFRTLRDWAIENEQAYFYFSAFDENWKGGPEASEVEKHWGVYKADRTPKLVFRSWTNRETSRAR
jgi:exo-beta-1,3-glucanase (GH17 family)